jgi:hypothetical protein
MVLFNLVYAIFSFNAIYYYCLLNKTNYPAILNLEMLKLT